MQFAALLFKALVYRLALCDRLDKSVVALKGAAEVVVEAVAPQLSIDGKGGDFVDHELALALVK